MSKREDLTGKRFGRLTVIDYHGTNERGRTQWLCKCDCGNTKIAESHRLKNGSVVSCGCYWKERLVECNTKHNLCKAHRKLYNEHRNMINRCHNDKCTIYDNYGGRGIKVCDRWRENINNFYEDVSVLPHFEEDGYSLDRIDNNGNYTPENVRWATNREQNLNRRNTLYVDYNGERRTLVEWSEMLDIPYNILYQRIKRLGSMESAITLGTQTK